MDPYMVYFIQEVTRWAGDNVITILLVGNALQWLQVMAARSPNTTDDKVVSLLIYFFSFKWLGLFKPKPPPPPVPGVIGKLFMG